MTTIRIGSDSEHIRISLPISYSSEGWAEAEVEIRVNGFYGQIRPWVEAADFESFTSQLRVLYETVGGTAELRPREEQFVLRLSARSLGHIAVSGEAWSYATYGSKLEFEFELDQSYLAQPLSELELLHTTIQTDLRSGS
jgi:hypothetical protein